VSLNNSQVDTGSSTKVLSVDSECQKFPADSYDEQQISAAGPTEWPPFSPDLNALYFYLWGKNV